MADIKWPRSFRKATELPREEVAAIVEQLIAELDTRDGDPDIELSGDEQDVGWPERPGMGNPPFTAPVDSEDCEPGGDEKDIAWTEWHKRGPSRQRSASHETVGSMDSEDEEEDDADEEDDHSGDPLDFAEGPADEIGGFCVRYGFDQSRPIGPDNPEML